MSMAQMQAMKQTSAEMQAAIGQMPDVDDVAEQQWELNEMLATTEEFTSAVSAGFDVGAVNVADMEAELAGLEGELAGIPVAPMAMGAGAAPWGAAAAQPYGLPQQQQQQYLPQQQQQQQLVPGYGGYGGGGGGGGGAVPSAPSAQPWLQQPANVPSAAAPPSSAYATGVSGLKM